MSGYTIRKVSELAAEYGEEFVNSVTNSFSCRYNDEVDDFLKRNSLDFARRKVSVTELVFDNESQLCAGRRLWVDGDCVVPLADCPW